MSGGQPQVGAKWAAGALLVLAGAVLGSGCHDDTPSMKAVNRASGTIGAVAGGAEAAVANDVQEKAFREAIRQLGEAKLDPSNPMASSMGVLTAASQLGAAGGPTAAAQTSMDRLSILAGEARSAVSQWTTFNAVAAATTYEAAPKLAELDKQLTVAKGEMAQAKDRLSKLQAEQDKMHASARDKADQALKFEQDSVKLKEDARKLKAADAQPVLARALEAKGKCDELRLAVARTEADATVLEPRKLEVKQKLDEIEIGIKSLEAERERIAKRGEDSGAAEKAARAKASEVAGSIDKVVKEIAEEREKNLVPALDAVVKGCRDAQASGGRGDASSGGRILSARAKQRLGEVLLLKAAEAAEQSALMKELAEIKPALPGAAGYADASKAAAEAAAAAREEAKAALEGARSDYKAVRVKGEANEAAKLAVMKYLTKIGGLTPDESEVAPPADGVEKPAEEAKPADAKGDQAKGDGKPADAAKGDEGEIKAMLAEAKAAGSSGVKLLAFMHFDDKSPIGEDAFRASAESADKVDEACKSKFGKTVSEHKKESGEDAKDDKVPGLLDLEHADLDALKIEVNGETAKVSDASDASLTVRKVEGKWKVELSSMTGPMLAAMGGNEKIIQAVFAAMPAVNAEVAAEVESGTIAKIEDVQPAFKAKLQAALMKALQPANGGGKGGGAGG